MKPTNVATLWPNVLTENKPRDVYVSNLTMTIKISNRDAYVGDIPLICTENVQRC